MHGEGQYLLLLFATEVLVHGWNLLGVLPVER